MTLGVIAFIGGWSWFGTLRFPSVSFLLRSLAAFHRDSADSGSNELCHIIYGRTLELCGGIGSADKEI
jgi:hypothetical protein